MDDFPDDLSYDADDNTDNGCSVRSRPPSPSSEVSAAYSTLSLGAMSAHSDSSYSALSVADSMPSMQTISDNPRARRTRVPGPPEILDASVVVALLAAMTVALTDSTTPSKHRDRPVNWTGGGGGGPSPVIDVPLSEEEEGELENLEVEKWIGSGKVWSDSLPATVKLARNAARCVPAHALSAASIPNGKLTVAELLSEDLPQPSRDSRNTAFTDDAVSAQPSSEDLFTST
ncbi:hypothetical protein DFH09DRAFT_1313510 [Mycena vulgaris]|nr:hypothetical protein DFH09DRAFT_1313510 [Mycena vulgaris]